MKKLGNEPAYPTLQRCYNCDGKTYTVDGLCLECNGIGHLQTGGLTKRERACIDLRIPESGVDWLDAMIAKAQRRDVAAKMMAARIWAQHDRLYSPVCARDAVLSSDALLAELAKEQT